MGAHNGRAIVCIQDAMGLARVSRRTIYNWLQQGRLDYVRTAGGAIRIYTDSLFRPPAAAAPPVLPPFPQGPLVPPQARAQFQQATRDVIVHDVILRERGWR